MNKKSSYSREASFLKKSTTIHEWCQGKGEDKRKCDVNNIFAFYIILTQYSLSKSAQDVIPYNSDELYGM